MGKNLYFYSFHKVDIYICHTHNTHAYTFYNHLTIRVLQLYYMCVTFV